MNFQEENQKVFVREITSENIYQILDDLITLQNEQKKKQINESPFKLYVNSEIKKWIDEHPKEFIEAYKAGIADFCERSGIMD